mmetsp:Transcript_524/g.572  ORF Transcript_524/g.572 Transcript_524/m.572 type:complete len:156 (-) Transcript_524:228-695(-)
MLLPFFHLRLCLIPLLFLQLLVQRLFVDEFSIFHHGLDSIFSILFDLGQVEIMLDFLFLNFLEFLVLLDFLAYSFLPFSLFPFLSVLLPLFLLPLSLLFMDLVQEHASIFLEVLFMVLSLISLIFIGFVAFRRRFSRQRVLKVLQLDVVGLQPHS